MAPLSFYLIHLLGTDHLISHSAPFCSQKRQRVWVLTAAENAAALPEAERKRVAARAVEKAMRSL